MSIQYVTTKLIDINLLLLDDLVAPNYMHSQQDHNHKSILVYQYHVTRLVILWALTSKKGKYRSVDSLSS